MALTMDKLQGGRPLDAIRQSVEDERLRILDAFRAAIRQPVPAADIAFPTLQAAIRPQRQASLSTEENQLLENGLRAILQEIVDNSVAAGQPLMAYGSDAAGSRSHRGGPMAPGPLTRLLDITLHLCERGHAEPGIVFKLFEDLTEAASIPDCKDVFSYIEGKHEVLGKAELLVRGKLVLLRACNHLIRRLSKASDVVFCGRILIFLTHFFPIYEKSAVNIKGHHNTANRTEYLKEPPGDVAAVDFAFYTTFWGLQDFFSNPATLFKESKWQQCAAGLEAVLSTFEAQPAEGDDGAAGQDVGLAPYSAKFLTAPKILPLQLKDRSLRRQILLQCLILLHFLQVPLKLEKSEVDKRSPLKDEVRLLETRVKKILESQFSKGKDFLKIVEQLLRREDNWVEWKRDGCQSFEKLAVAPAPEPVERPGKRPRYAWGNKELDKLVKWSESHPDSVTDVGRINRVDVRDHFKALAEDLDPEAGIEEEYSHKKVKVYCWRGLRLAARQDMESFGRYADHGIEGAVPLDLLTERAKAKVYPPKAAEPPKARSKKLPPGGSSPSPSAPPAGDDAQLGGRSKTPARTPEPTPMQLDAAPPAGTLHPAVPAATDPAPPVATVPTPAVAPTDTAAALAPSLLPPGGTPEGRGAEAVPPTTSAERRDQRGGAAALAPPTDMPPGAPSEPPARPAPAQELAEAARAEAGSGLSSQPDLGPALDLGRAPSPALASGPAGPGQLRMVDAEPPGGRPATKDVATAPGAAAAEAVGGSQPVEEARPGKLPAGAVATAAASAKAAAVGRSAAAIKAAAAASRALNPNPNTGGAPGGSPAALPSSQPPKAGAGAAAFDLNAPPSEDPARPGTAAGRGLPSGKRGATRTRQLGHTL